LLFKLFLEIVQVNTRNVSALAGFEEIIAGKVPDIIASSSTTNFENKRRQQ